VGLRASLLKGIAWYYPQNVYREVANDHFAWGFVSYIIGFGVEYSLVAKAPFSVAYVSDGLTEC
jgi:hypothetical protein